MRKILILPFLLVLLFMTENIQAQQKLLWSDIFLQRISIADIDGTNQEVLLSGNNAAYHDVDFTNSKIYWSSYGNEAIYVSDLDGSNQQILTTLSDEPQGISLSANGDIYVIVGTSIKHFDNNG